MTPGPWRYEKRFATGVVVNAEGEVVAQDVGPADGPVFAAAQELLEVVRGMLCHACGYRVAEAREGPTCVVCERARVALKKAESRP